MNTIKDKIITFHRCFQLNLIFRKKGFKKFVMISMLSLFECITQSSSMFLEEIKLIAIVIVII